MTDCVQASDGKAYCFPACKSASSCSDYPGTHRQSGTTYLGNAVAICSP